MEDRYYELFHCGIKTQNSIRKILYPNEINIEQIIYHTLKELSFVRPIYSYEYKFNYNEYFPVPIYKKKEKIIDIKYEHISLNKNIQTYFNEYIKEYQNYHLSTLPLIDVTDVLGIKVQAANTEEAFGSYYPTKKLIVIRSDYKPTFLHELAHAIDFFLGNDTDVEEIDEVVAELSSIVLCKMYNIPFNIQYSKYYLNMQADAADYIDTCVANNDFELLERSILIRVKKICEYVLKCQEEIYGKKQQFQTKLYKMYY